MAKGLNVSPAELDLLMNRGWPGLGVVDLDGWLARVGGGVTQRANSVLPLKAPGDVRDTFERVERLYRERHIDPTFQISPAARPGDLDRLLDERGYERRSPTMVQVAPINTLLSRLPGSSASVTIDTAPDDAWVRLWWSVDGRGDEQRLEIATRILAGCPALYASLHDDGGIAAVGRLALVDTWGGVYCMAVRPDARRCGYARGILRALAQAAHASRIGALWLQVMESNTAARALYRSAGFVDASRYHYRVARASDASADALRMVQAAHPQPNRTRS